MTLQEEKKLYARNKAVLTNPDIHKLFDDRIICLLGFGGSIAYGTNIPTSDIDIRGIYINPIDELIGLKPDSETHIPSEGDTVLYSLKKIFKLLTDCNPNVIELLGLSPYEYLYWDNYGRLILDHTEDFLSKKAALTFGGYAKSQLNRLINKSGRANSEINQNETRSIEKVLTNMENRYKQYGNIHVYLDDNTIKFDTEFHDFPIDAMIRLLNEINVVQKDYCKSVRNDKAIAHNKLSKHMMHLIRLYMMGIDIMHHHAVITYRGGTDHELLMSIRNGDFLESDQKTPTKEFNELVTQYQTMFEDSVAKSTLPDKPNYKAIEALYEYIVIDVVHEYVEQNKVNNFFKKDSLLTQQQKKLQAHIEAYDS